MGVLGPETVSEPGNWHWNSRGDGRGNHLWNFSRWRKCACGNPTSGAGLRAVRNPNVRSPPSLSSNPHDSPEPGDRGWRDTCQEDWGGSVSVTGCRDETSGNTGVVLAPTARPRPMSGV